MFGRNTSASTRAAKKADKATYNAEKKVDKKAAKAADKAAKKAEKADEKADKATYKAEKKAYKAADKAAEKGTGKAVAVAKRADRKAARTAAKAAPKSVFDRVTDPKSARRALTAAKVVGPAIAPLALKAATSTREYLDTRKAAKLGVSPEEVGAYRGPTGATEARLRGLEGSIAELNSRRNGDLQVTRFSDVSGTRIADLRTAVRAAATMPAGRRRMTLSAVNKELDQIDADLMTFLVSR